MSPNNKRGSERDSAAGGGGQFKKKERDKHGYDGGKNLFSKGEILL